MSKKYVPSGYQIIELKETVSKSGVALSKIPETEDEKILYEILHTSDYSKPLLINAEIHNEDTDNTLRLLQFAVIIDDVMFLGDLGESNQSSLTVQAINDGTLNIELKEI